MAINDGIGLYLKEDSSADYREKWKFSAESVHSAVSTWQENKLRAVEACEAELGRIERQLFDLRQQIEFAEEWLQKFTVPSRQTATPENPSPAPRKATMPALLRRKIIAAMQIHVPRCSGLSRTEILDMWQAAYEARKPGATRILEIATIPESELEL
jgi:hypothetical protein